MCPRWKKNTERKIWTLRKCVIFSIQTANMSILGAQYTCFLWILRLISCSISLSMRQRAYYYFHFREFFRYCVAWFYFEVYEMNLFLFFLYRTKNTRWFTFFRLTFSVLSVLLRFDPYVYSLFLLPFLFVFEWQRPPFVDGKRTWRICVQCSSLCVC